MSIQSLVASGSKVWIDSIDPKLVQRDRARGITGATSNPVIVADLIDTGLLDQEIEAAIHRGQSDHDIAWNMTDLLVRRAEEQFMPVWEKTGGNDGYVSFELDPLLEDPDADLPVATAGGAIYRVGQEWAAGQRTASSRCPPPRRELRPWNRWWPRA